jgi:hypothetical protein
MKRILAPLALAALLAAPTLRAARTDDVDSTPMQQQVPGAIPVPFGVGERLTYDVKFGPVRAGSGSMEISGIEPMRGLPAYHVRFHVTGGALFYKVNDAYDSWMDVRNLNSLRFVQDLNEGRKERDKRFDIYPERAAYVEEGKPEKASVSQPLDDASFLYFVRTIPLVVGQTYEFNRYFRPDRNPVKIKVLRRERIEVPAGKFNAIVIQPIIKTSGIFGENGHAEIWLSDDGARMMLQMKSQLKFGSLNLYLTGIRPGTGATPAPPTR